MQYIIIFGLMIFAYLLGSISSAVIICKLWGLPDPRTEGSKNPGTTNVLRLGGKWPALATLICDGLKGVIPVLLAKWLGVAPMLQAIILLLACMGHMFPLFFGFKGGKGVATALGGIIALAWPVGFAMLGTWLIVAAIFRYSSLAAILSFIFLPIYIWTLSDRSYIIPLCLLSVIILFMHRENIKRLISGQESKIGAK